MKPPSPGRVLVVDDQEPARFVKVQTLRRAGFEVDEAGTGRGALALFARSTPDVVICDVNLPDISGTEVSRTIKTSSTIPPVQIMQVSNTAVTAADHVRGLEQGADVYLIEPIDASVLVAAVRSLMRVRLAEAALAAALEAERAARAAAEEADRVKDEFIATLSHELRTPLNALMGWIWQLRHSTLDGPARTRALDSLERNTALQAQLINDLLDISRISKGKLQLRLSLVELRSFLEESVAMIRESAERKHLQIETALEDPVWVAGDRARLHQVVVNLLTNAVQFTPDGGRIRVSLTADDRRGAILEVRDSGAGIDAAFLPFVFEPFRQGAGRLSRRHGGLGLGLSVVRQLVELHDGSVGVASEGVGSGTTLTVSLPVEPPPGPGSKPDSPLLEGLTVVAFDPRGTEDVVAALEASGAKSAIAASIEEAVALHAGEGHAVLLSAIPPPGRVPFVQVNRPLHPYRLVRSIAHFVLSSVS
jgi:two-component system, sensor histidine kinase